MCMARKEFRKYFTQTVQLTGTDCVQVLADAVHCCRIKIHSHGNVINSVGHGRVGRKAGSICSPYLVLLLILLAGREPEVVYKNTL